MKKLLDLSSRSGDNRIQAVLLHCISASIICDRGSAFVNKYSDEVVSGGITKRTGGKCAMKI